LNAQLKADNHDISLDEKLDIITTCFDKNVNSVITQIPDLEELYSFKKCVRKYARVKMRAITYYHKELHKKEADNAQYLIKNLKMFSRFMPQTK
jgi:hypothetical protein